MGNSLSSGQQPPYPIRAVPLSYGGLFLNLGLFLNCLAIDTAPVGDETKLLDLLGGYYFRRAVSPSKPSTVIQLLGLILGGLYFTKNFVGVFTTSASARRKRSDIIGFILYIAQVYWTVRNTKPLERAFGLQFLKDAKNRWAMVQTRTQQGKLFQAHTVNVLLTIALIIQQTISFRTQLTN